MISLLLKVRPKDRPDAETLLKSSVVRKKAGIILDENEKLMFEESDPLLKTIKYNPYNLNSIKEKLPKSSYEEPDRSLKGSLEKVGNRERVLSACGMRN